MNGHYVVERSDGTVSCSCGEQGSDLEVLDHAILMTAVAVADQIAADPTSSPDLIARAEQNARDAAALR